MSRDFKDWNSCSVNAPLSRNCASSTNCSAMLRADESCILFLIFHRSGSLSGSGKIIPRCVTGIWNRRDFCGRFGAPGRDEQVSSSCPTGVPEVLEPRPPLRSPQCLHLPAITHPLTFGIGGIPLISNKVQHFQKLRIQILFRQR